MALSDVAMEMDGNSGNIVMCSINFIHLIIVPGICSLNSLNNSSHFYIPRSIAVRETTLPTHQIVY